jgi:hypothetical protein
MSDKYMRLCGQDVSVIETDPAEWAENGMGRSNTKSGCILIRPNMPETVKGGTLIHEVLHYAGDCNGLELTESQVSALACALHAWMRDNPVTIFGIMGVERGDDDIIGVPN